jgi:hypothetical protein
MQQQTKMLRGQNVSLLKRAIADGRRMTVMSPSRFSQIFCGEGSKFAHSLIFLKSF